MSASVTSRSKYGAIRKWFLAAQQSGEFIGIRYGHVPLGTGEPEWLYYPHAEFDGIGAFAEILRHRGVELKTLPQIKYYPAYSPIVSALKHWPRYVAPRRPLKWVPMERDLNWCPATRPPAAIAWHLFEEPTTIRIRHDSRKVGATVNTFLLHHLTNAIRPFLEDRLAAVPWMIPVNMRGGANQYRDTDNHTSYVAIHVRADEPVAEIHRKILKALSRGEHWGNWHAFKLGHCATARMRTKIMTQGKAISQWNVGAFSNLGDWDADKRITVREVIGDWLFCPPTLRTQTLAAGCVTFQGRLSLMIQTHPELTTSTATVQTWMKNWVAGIESGLVKIETDTAAAALAARAA